MCVRVSVCLGFEHLAVEALWSASRASGLRQAITTVEQTRAARGSNTSFMSSVSLERRKGTWVSHPARALEAAVRARMHSLSAIKEVLIALERKGAGQL